MVNLKFLETKLCFPFNQFQTRAVHLILTLTLSFLLPKSQEICMWTSLHTLETCSLFKANKNAKLPVIDSVLRHSSVGNLSI